MLHRAYSSEIRFFDVLHHKVRTLCSMFGISNVHDSLSAKHDNQNVVYLLDAESISSLALRFLVSDQHLIDHSVCFVRCSGCRNCRCDPLS